MKDKHLVLYLQMFCFVEIVSYCKIAGPLSLPHRKEIMTDLQMLLRLLENLIDEICIFNDGLYIYISLRIGLIIVLYIVAFGTLVAWRSATRTRFGTLVVGRSAMRTLDGIRGNKQCYGRI